MFLTQMTIQNNIHLQLLTVAVKFLKLPVMVNIVNVWVNCLLETRASCHFASQTQKLMYQTIIAGFYFCNVACHASIVMACQIYLQDKVCHVDEHVEYALHSKVTTKVVGKEDRLPPQAEQMSIR